MRILGACSLGGAGHWLPLRVLLEVARDRGADVRVVAPPALVPMVEADGFACVAGGEPPESEIAPRRARLAVASRAEASVIGNREIFGRLATAAMLPGVDSICARWDPDLVLRDPCEYASAIVAAERGLDVAQVAISPARSEWGSIAAAAPAVDEYRPGTADRLRAMPYLSGFPHRLDPSPFPNTLRYAVVEGDEPEPLPDWWNGSTEPLVYVSLGTVVPHMSDAPAHYRAIVEAVAGLGVRVLLTVGSHLDPAALGDPPRRVHVERWVQHERAVAGASLVICHGGSGTVFRTVAAGVPLVVIPHFGDQYTNAAMVEEQGLGAVVHRAVHPDPPSGSSTSSAPSPVVDPGELRDAVARLLADPLLTRRCRSVAREVTAGPSPEQALDLLGGRSAGVHGRRDTPPLP